MTTEPKPVSPAVCMVIESEDNKFLLTKRSFNLIFPGAWVFPGGHLEPNETLLECGIRETREEIGINIGISAD